MRKQALGKGLDAILGGGRGMEEMPRRGALIQAEAAGRPLMIEIEKVSAGRAQPRRKFDDGALEELASSIKEKGILQPLIVIESGGGFELIAGERRLRAAARAGLERVPVIVKRDVDPQEMVELALIENIQREDLTPLEEARAYQRLMDEYAYTQEETARRVGKSRAAVANSVRLLGLPAVVQELIETGVLSEGHGRALLAMPTSAAQIQLAQKVARRGLSVRETEEATRAVKEEGPRGTDGRRRDPELVALERSLARTLATKVRVRTSGKGGTVSIDFYSQEELTRLADRLTG
ncbi:MAG: ParB/RepB/Spo0J family partition protein [Candidatus Binatia bacterium]